MGFRPPRVRIVVEQSETSPAKGLLAARPGQTSLPTRWDSREEGWVSSVKRQGGVGASWLAGFDPADPDDGELKVAISVVNNVQHLTWTPDLGSFARTYTILGSETISSPVWEEVTDLETTRAKYFKVTISPP